MKLRLIFSAMLFALFALNAPHANAWNCSNPLDARVDVGTQKPSGSAGDGDNQYFLGTGTEGVKGDYYVCKPPTTDPTGPSNTLKQKQKQQQQQNQTATGGTSVLKNSGNSTNTNTNQASSTSAASNNGNGANNSTYESNTNVDASRIPVNTAIALAPPSNLNCSVGYGAGAQTMNVGASLGFSRVNKNCELLTTSLTAKNRLTYCKIWVSNKYAKKAGVTLEDCLQQDTVAVQTPIAAAAISAPAPVVVPAPNVTVVLPAPLAAPQPVVTAEAEQASYLGKCTVDRINTCKAFINQAIQGHAFGLRVVGPREATFVAQFLRERHSGMRLEQRLSDDQNSMVTLYLLYPSESVSLGQ